MMGNLGGLMRQMSQMQQRAEQLKEELAAKRVAASAGGLVDCVVDGTGKLVSIRLDGSKLGLDEETTEVLQDAIEAALKEAAQQAESEAQAMFSQLTGGLKLPPGLGL